MPLVMPDPRDISDVAIAIRSFSDAWGSVNPIGQYEEAIDPHRLWLMFRVDESDLKVIFSDCVPETYSLRFTVPDGFGNGVIHAHAYKHRKWPFPVRWFAKVTCVVGDAEYPLGFLGARYQSQIWCKLHDILMYDGMFLETSEEALDY